MFGHYFNYHSHIANGYWDRRTFLRRLWRIYADDPRWTPPAFSTLQRANQPKRYAYIYRASPELLSVEALRRSSRRMTVTNSSSGAIGASGSIFETPVAAVALMADPRRADRTTYLGLFRFVNDDEVLDQLLDILTEQLWRSGCRRIVGPSGLSPRLQSGVLRDSFDRPPPLGTPYNPPYMHELLDQAMHPLYHSHLFHIGLSDGIESEGAGPAELKQSTPSRYSDELLWLFAQAFGHDDNTPQVDRAEAIFLIDWIQSWPCEFWLATIDDEAVGFLVLQPDLSSMVRRTNGGRNPLWKPLIWFQQKRPTHSGRLVHLAVDQEWRERGIGRQLWHHALNRGRQLGWQSITVGPVVDGTTAAEFLEHMGATQQQHYTTYYRDI